MSSFCWRPGWYLTASGSSSFQLLPCAQLGPGFTWVPLCLKVPVTKL